MRPGANAFDVRWPGPPLCDGANFVFGRAFSIHVRRDIEVIGDAVAVIVVDIDARNQVTVRVEGLDKGGMRHLSDTLMSKIKSGVVVLGRTDEDKVSFIVRVSDDLTSKVKAGEIVKNIAPIVSGRGGGKPDMAEGGGTDASKLSDALEASYGVVERMLV